MARAKPEGERHEVAANSRAPPVLTPPRRGGSAEEMTEVNLQEANNNTEQKGMSTENRDSQVRTASRETRGAEGAQFGAPANSSTAVVSANPLDVAVQIPSTEKPAMNGSLAADKGGGDGGGAGKNNDQEPGWLKKLYISSQNRFVQCALGVLAPVLPWLPIVLRVLQLLCSLIAFSVMASSDHPVSCIDAAGVFCWTGRTYANFTAFHYLVVVAVIVFVWSALILIIDMVGAFKFGVFVAETATAYMPGAALYGDVALTFLSFGAACAASGLRTGLGDMNNNYCESTSASWCDKINASCVFMFFTWLLLVPSAVLNTSNRNGPW